MKNLFEGLTLDEAVYPNDIIHNENITIVGNIILTPPYGPSQINILGAITEYPSGPAGSRDPRMIEGSITVSTSDGRSGNTQGALFWRNTFVDKRSAIEYVKAMLTKMKFNTTIE